MKVRTWIRLGLFVLVASWVGALVPAGPAISQTVQVPRTGQTKCYDGTGAQAGCAGSWQDAEFRAGLSWPDPRFTAGTDGESNCMVDNLTGLMWPKNGNLRGAELDWNHAIDYANNLTLCGYSDWRLPNINELESLWNYDTEYTNTWLESNGFTHVQYNAYWTSTSFSATNAASVKSWANIGSDNKSNTMSVWPVRTKSAGSVLAQTGQTVSYRTNDDGAVRAGAAWPSERFGDLENGTVMDNLTGLIWIKDPSSSPSGCAIGVTKSWQEAVDYVTCLNEKEYLGHADWRFPNIREMRSLVSYGAEYQGLPSIAPFLNVSADYYRSSTFRYGNSDFVTDRFIGAVDAPGLNDHFGYMFSAWPVRGGQREKRYSYHVIDGPPGWTGIRVCGINNSGTIAGDGLDASARRGFIYDGSAYTSFDVPVGLSEFNSIGAINNNGTVVATAEGKGFTYYAGTYNIIDGPPGWDWAKAYAINDSGTVAGSGGNDGAQQKLFLQAGGATTIIDPPSGWVQTWASGINNSGTIVGEAFVDSVLKAFTYKGGVFELLGAPFGWGAASALAINNKNDIVGTNTYEFGSSTKGFIFSNGLFAVLDGPSGWQGFLPCGINDDGVIVGFGVDGTGAVKSFLATPEEAVNGVCGSANGKSFSSAPAVNLCLSGTASSVSGSGPWSWTCGGADGGTSATCTASRAGTPRISVAPSSVNFGSIEKGAVTMKIVRIKNTGDGMLEVGTPTTDDSQFSISGNGCTGAISEGLYCTITVTFTPASFGKATARLTIPSNDTRPGKSSYVVPLKGLAPPPKISAPSSHNMGAVSVAATPASKTIYVKNKGLSDLNIASITLTGNTAFAQTNTCEASPVVKGTPCAIFVSFDPAATGPAKGTITIVSDDPRHPSKTITLKGKGK